MASSSNFDNIATVHLMRWEAERIGDTGEIPYLDFERGGHGVVWDVCKRAGSTDEEAGSVATGFTFGLQIGEAIAAEPFDDYSWIRSAMDRFATSIGTLKDSYMRGDGEELLSVVEVDETRATLDKTVTKASEQESLGDVVARTTYALNAAKLVNTRCDELMRQMRGAGIDETSALGQIVLREVMKCSKAAYAEMESALARATEQLAAAI